MRDTLDFDHEAGLGTCFMGLLELSYSKLIWKGISLGTHPCGFQLI